MTKEELIQYIDDNIYENQDGEITGEALNAVLKAIVNDGGTEVEANPTGEATTPLNKIKIGETNYNIPQTDTSNLVTEQELAQELSGYVQRTDPPSPAAGDLVAFDEYGGFGTSGKTAAEFATSTQGAKADTALQPTGVKTINGQSIVGTGNITIEDSGTDDYADLDNKPQINSVVLSGNKSASDLGLATAAQGAKADTALQPKQSGQYVENNFASFDANGGIQDSNYKAADFVQNITRGCSTLTKTNGVVDIPEEIQNVEATPVAAGGSPTVNLTNGTLTFGIPSGADAYNPFKGTYLITDTLPTTGQAGDYIYVVDSATPPVPHVYTWNGTAFVDSGETVTMGDSQFANSTIPISQTNIVNNFTTGGAQNVASAEEVKTIFVDNAKTSNSFNFSFNGALATELKVFINTSANMITVTSNQDRYLAIPCKGGDVIEIERNDNIATEVLFLKTLIPYRVNQPLVFSEESGFTEVKGLSVLNYHYSYTVPQDVTFILCKVRTSSATENNMTPKLLKLNGVDLFKSFPERVDEKVQYGSDLSSRVTLDGNYNVTGGVTNSVKWKHYLLEVKPGDVVVTNYKHNASYTFAYNCLFAADGKTLVRLFNCTDNYVVTIEDWNDGARYYGVSYRLEEPSVNNSPYLYVTRNFGMSAMYTADDLSTAAKIVKDKVVVKFENLYNFDVFTYDKKGRKIHHNFIRENKVWDSLEYLDGNGETQTATNVQSANIWYCDEIKYGTKHLCQGNTNFINNPNAPVGNGLYVGNGHGCEVMQYVKFLIDGKEFDISVSSDELVGNEFKMVMVSDIYPSAGGNQYVATNIPKLDTSGNPVVLFKHFMEVTITSDSDVIVDNKLEICQDNVSWLSCDAAMMECNFGDFNTVVLSGRGKTYMSSVADDGTPTSLAGTDGVVNATAVYASKVEMYGKGFYVSNEIIPMFDEAHCVVYPNYYDNRLKCYIYPVRCSRAVGSDTPQVFNTGDIIATHNIRHVRLSDDIEV